MTRLLGSLRFLLCGFSHRDGYGVNSKDKLKLLTLPDTVLLCIGMDPELLKQVMSELGKKGGAARAKALTKRQRKASATKASKAAAAARKKKAKERKKDQK